MRRRTTRNTPNRHSLGERDVWARVTTASLSPRAFQAQNMADQRLTTHHGYLVQGKQVPLFFEMEI